MVEIITKLFRFRLSDFLWSYIIITVFICCALVFSLGVLGLYSFDSSRRWSGSVESDKSQPEEIGHDELSMEVKVIAR